MSKSLLEDEYQSN